MSVPVGIAGLGRYEPEAIMSAEEIAAASGIPAEVVREKFGLEEKRIAGEGEHASDMAAEAGRRALEDASERLGREVGPADLDGIIYFGSTYKDYRVWLAAPRVQHLLGAGGAWAFELSATSGGAPFALRVAADMMAADGGPATVLLVASSRESHLIDFDNERSRFMFNFGDGAAAAVLVRDLPLNTIGGSSFLTDGSFSEDVRVEAGGSRLPPSVATVEQGRHCLDVRDPDDMKRRLDPVSLDRFERVAREAARRSGGNSDGEPDFLAVLHTKRSLHEALLERLGLDSERTVYLDHHGHLSAADPLLGLLDGERLGRLRDGDLAVALSAGTGYTWAGTGVRWGASP
ncbi:MAG: 3-oxoacyl-ACP synthase [Gemmatimonadota bacterium]